MSELPPGEVLKTRYKIIQQLGQGGMGEVYLAEDQSLANQVAVKANHNLNAHASAQFIREARLLASLKHPNLPRVIDYFTEGESQYLVMDYIPGNDLRALIEGKNAVSLPLVLKWATELGNAITYLHNQNPPIFHRDIKPANIKLMPSGEVVLVDFGIAKTGDPSQETQTGAWGYTPGFAPPEQVSGLRTGPYSDQFSLAATLYYLLAGKPPVDSAQRMMGSAEYEPLTTIKPEIPAHVSNAIDRALSLKPEGRFSTIGDFVAALENTHPIPEPASVQRTVIGGRASIPPPPTGIPPVGVQEVSGEKPRRSKTFIWIILAVVAIGLIAGGAFLLNSLGILGAPASPEPTLPPPTEAPVIIVVPTYQPTNESVTATEAPSVTEAVAPTNEPTEAPILTELPFGDRIAFVSNRQGDGYFQVWWMKIQLDADGKFVASEPQQLTFDQGDKSNPSFSPDGTKLLYSGWSSGTSSNGTPLAADIWMLDLSQPGSEPVDLSLRPKDDKYPSWSPDGKYIAFTSFYRDDNMPQLILMNADATEQTLLGEGAFSESYSTWTRDNNFLYYVVSTQGLQVVYMRDKFNLFQNPTAKFDRKTDEGRLGLVSEPNISPDGSMLVYTALSGIDNVKRNIYTAVMADRGNTVTALTTTGLDFAPCWSPDSNWIVFTTQRDGDAEIYIMDKIGGQLVNLTNFPSIDKEPSWQLVKIP